MSFLTGQKIKDTYQSLLKTNDNGLITSVYKAITDGTGSISGLYLKNDGVLVSGSLVANNITGSLYGNASTSTTASYALTASYIQNYGSTKIVAGNIEASVDTNPNNLFAIKSGSSSYFNVSSNANMTINSNIFTVNNYDTNTSVLIISQSIAKFATQSSPPNGIAEVGSIWFTATDMYIGLD